MGKLVEAEITLKYSNGQLTIASTPNTIKGDGLLSYLDLAECTAARMAATAWQTFRAHERRPTIMQACEQLSLFSIVPQAARTAICCMDGECKAAAPAESWMADLVPGGEYAISIAGHTLVLKPVPGTPAGIQQGHEYYHYTIGPRLYAGTFVGRMQH